jgi:hypothetical protein
MSTVESDLDVPGGAAQPAPGDTEVTAARLARVGDLDVRRLLPLRQRRSVGAWCFVDLAPGSLLYLPPGRESAAITARAGARLFLLGGEPLGETLLMWWNFVGRTPDDIAKAARDWASGQRFGPVAGYRGEPLAAPPLDPLRLARKAR